MDSVETPQLVLYSSPISNASARLRIALNLKRLPYKLVSINLSKGEQHHPEFRAINSTGTVPALVHHLSESTQSTIIGQSIAALEYLDEAFPETRQLLPSDPVLKAHVRTLVAILAGDTHPLLTHRVSKAIRELFPEAKTDGGNAVWDKYWVLVGMEKFNTMLPNCSLSSKYCVGDEVTIADLVLLPEFWFASRLGVDMHSFEHIEKVCSRLCLIEGIQKEQQSLER